MGLAWPNYYFNNMHSFEVVTYEYKLHIYLRKEWTYSVIVDVNDD